MPPDPLTPPPKLSVVTCALLMERGMGVGVGVGLGAGVGMGVTLLPVASGQEPIRTSQASEAEVWLSPNRRGLGDEGAPDSFNGMEVKQLMYQACTSDTRLKACYDSM